jgi:hypothetical protein
VVAAATLVTYLVAVLPLFVCMPLWVDATFFDICARTIIQKGVLYREILLHGPPGMALAVAGVRYALGWRSEVLRLWDALMILGVVFLLVRYFLPETGRLAPRLWTAIALILCYFSTTEWCHCQPDVWMMLPALAALILRLRRPPQAIGTGFSVSCLLEGACWTLAALLKPFIFVPAGFCWLTDTLSVWHHGRLTVSRLLSELVALSLGAAAPVLMVVGWLVWSGNWSYFIETIGGSWNRDYFATSAGMLDRWNRLLTLLWPWNVVQAIALPLAFWLLLANVFVGTNAVPADRRSVLLAACFVGWFMEANFLQRQTPYQALPSVLLGMTFVAGWPWPRRILVCACLAWSMWQQPLLSSQRLAVWNRCLHEGSSPELRDRLTLEEDSFVAPNWEELEIVRAHLAARHIQDGQLTCYSLSTVPLYLQLNIKPSTRYVLLQTAIEFFPSARTRLTRELMASPERFVVNDLRQLTLGGQQLGRAEAEQEVPGKPLALPPSVPAAVMNYYPFNLPIVFRAGRYLIHEVPPGLRNTR